MGVWIVRPNQWKCRMCRGRVLCRYVVLLNGFLSQSKLVEGRPSIDIDPHEEILAGRSAKAHPLLHFRDLRYSSVHCRFRWENGEPRTCMCEDMSGNGVYVNGTLIGKGNSAVLSDGDVITFLVPSVEDKEKVKDEFYAFKFVYNRLSLNISPPETSVERKRKLDDSGRPKRVKIGLEQELTCAICSDVLYKCTSVVPCLHNFCSACLSSWMNRGTDCPQCRVRIQSVRRNHTVSNVVESFLESNPSFKRADKEYAEMDAVDAIPVDGIHVRPIGPSPRSRSGRSVAKRCRECDALHEDGFQCAARNPAHLTCVACQCLFPRRPDVLIQQCAICSKAFCDLYWGCPAVPGQGALRDVRAWAFTSLPEKLFSGNSFEREVLLCYLRSQSMSVNDFWLRCCDGADAGDLSLVSSFGQDFRLSRDRVICQPCAIDIFCMLAYQFRSSVAKAELPVEVNGHAVDREDCWWGFECRTQLHSAHHAEKLNHVCDPKKRTRRLRNTTLP